MICPYCNLGISMEFEEGFVHPDKDFEKTGNGLLVEWDICPECDGTIIQMHQGKYKKTEYGGTLSDTVSKFIIFPLNSTRQVESEVPDSYKGEFLEASAVLNISPKASAALSRRVLQSVLRNKFGISHRSLAAEIDEFISLPSIPSYLSKAVDAIRNVGNFAAHPLKDTNTGEIIDVEPGEAEWLLEVLEALFDFTFVQPVRLEERKKKLNDKLAAAGKPKMKE